MEEINEDRIMDLLAEHNIFELLINYMHKRHAWCVCCHNSVSVPVREIDCSPVCVCVCVYMRASDCSVCVTE
jgi:hypothetical protein